MAVRVRLRRMGNRNNPFYRVVAADARSGPTGVVVETLGWYDPKKGGTNFKLKADRIEYWKSNGAEFSPTVNTLVKRLANAPVDPPAPVAAPAIATAEPAPAPAPPVEAEPTAEPTPSESPEPGDAS